MSQSSYIDCKGLEKILTNFWVDVPIIKALWLFKYIVRNLVDGLGFLDSQPTIWLDVIVGGSACFCSCIYVIQLHYVVYWPHSRKKETIFSLLNCIKILQEKHHRSSFPIVFLFKKAAFIPVNWWHRPSQLSVHPKANAPPQPTEFYYWCWCFQCLRNIAFPVNWVSTIFVLFEETFNVCLESIVRTHLIACAPWMLHPYCVWIKCMKSIHLQLFTFPMRCS